MNLAKRIHEAKRLHFFFGFQLALDICQVVLNREFKFGRERIKRFVKAVSEDFGAFGGIWNNDTKDTEYARSVLDRKLEEICGDDFIPWEKRYLF